MAVKVTKKGSNNAEKSSNKSTKNTKSGESKSAKGAPVKYIKSYVDQGYKLALRGCTDSEIADIIGVGVSTIYYWKNKYPDFKDAIQAGREDADDKVIESLFKLATGYDYEETVIVKTVKGTGQNKQETQRLAKAKKHREPSLQAIRYWLSVRQSYRWHVGKDPKPVIEQTDQGVEFVKAIEKLLDAAPKQETTTESIPYLDGEYVEKD